MIYIITTDRDEFTDKVIDRLICKKIEYKRITKLVQLTEKNIFEDIVKNVSSNFFWIRKVPAIGDFELELKDVQSEYFEDIKGQTDALEKTLGIEVKNLFEYISELYRKNNRIIGGTFNSINKLIVLEKAKDVGLKTPTYSVLSTKQKLSEFCNQGFEGITKSISNTVRIKMDNKSLLNYTSTISNPDSYHDSFFPSLVQERIHKQFEIRVFYLLGEFYSVAIFSQNEESSKVDYRVVKPKNIRTIPYDLEDDVKHGLNKLVSSFDLNCCSIDLLYTLNDEYVFLEINPVGQIDMVSMPGGYNLDEKVFNIIST